MRFHILIMGIPGSGKTHLTNYFRERGMNAYDADEVKGLGRWIDKKGKRVAYVHPEADEKWLSKHQWIWSRRILKSLLKTNKELFLFGSSSDIYKFVDFFDKVYYLKAGRTLISDRLQHKERGNWFGKPKTQRRAILSWIDDSDERAHKAGAEFIDASLSPKRIFDRICKGVAKSSEKAR